MHTYPAHDFATNDGKSDTKYLGDNEYGNNDGAVQYFLKKMHSILCEKYRDVELTPIYMLIAIISIYSEMSSI